MLQIIKRFYYSFKLLKGLDNMAMVYATLIVKGYKTFEQVPDVIKPQVREVLIQLDAAHLLPVEPEEPKTETEA